MKHAHEAFKVDLIGVKIANRYLIERELHASPLCVIFRAEDEKRARSVALRVYSPLVALDRPETQAWSQDIERVGKWAHHHFLPTQDLGRVEGGEADGLLYSVEPFVKSGSLEELLKGGELPLDEALSYGLQLLSSLQVMHEAGHYHLNLRPSNLFVNENDFGLKQLIVSGVGSHHFFDFKAATSGETLAHPLYLIPELVQGATADARSDLYAFGSLLYEMVTGRTPFPHRDAKRAARSHINDRPVKARLANPRAKLPRELDDFIMSCLEKDPTRRPESARSAKQLLEKFLGQGSQSIKSNLTTLFTPSPEDLVKSAEEEPSEGKAAERDDQPVEGPVEEPVEQAAELAAEPIPSSVAEAPPIMNQTMVGYTAPEELKALIEREDALRAEQERAEQEREQSEREAQDSEAEAKADAEAKAEAEAKTAQVAAEKESAAARQAEAEAAQDKADEEAQAKANEEAAQLKELERQESQAALKIAAKDERNQAKPQTKLHRADEGTDDTLGWFVDQPEDLEFEEDHKPFNAFGKIIIVLALAFSVGVYFLTQGSTDDPEGSDASSSKAAPQELASAQGVESSSKVNEQEPTPASGGARAGQATTEVGDKPEAELKAKAGAEAKTEAEAKAKAEAEAKAKAEAEAEAKAKAEAEAKAKAEAEAKAKAEAEAKAKAEAEAKAKAEAEAKAKASKRASQKKRSESLEAYKGYIKRAKRAQSRRSWAQVEREAQAAIKANSRGWQGYALLGEAHFKRGQHEQAARAFKRSTRYSRRASTYLDLGQAYYKLKQYRDAQKAWEKAQAVGRGNDKAKAERYLKMIEKKLK